MAFVNLHAIEQAQHGYNVASMAWNRHAIAQTQLRKHVASVEKRRDNLISTQTSAAELALHAPR